MKQQTAAGLHSWTISNFNYYPNGATAVSIVALLTTAVWTDYTKKRYQVNLVIAAVMVVAAALILAQDRIGTGGALASLVPSRGLEPDLTLPRSPRTAVFFAFYIAGISYAGQASNFSWANDLTRDDEQERGIVLASMNMFSNAFNAWCVSVVSSEEDGELMRWLDGRGKVEYRLLPSGPCAVLAQRNGPSLPLPLLSPSL